MLIPNLFMPALKNAPKKCKDKNYANSEYLCFWTFFKVFVYNFLKLL
jgi:hypothetical protein